MPDALTDEDYRIGLGEIDFNCLDECFVDFPDTKILVVAVSEHTGDSPNVYDLGCAEDTWKSPGEFDDRRLVGTHWLSDEALQVLCADDLDVYHPEVWREDCRETCDRGAPVIVVAIDADGQFHLLCTECAYDVQKHPDDSCNRGLVLHGTHILADDLLHELFPEDFED